MDSDGSEQTQLTQQGVNVSPSWDPDGDGIAFTSNRTGGPEVFLMDRDGTDQARLTDDPRPDDYPAFSPAGDRIAFRNNLQSIWVTGIGGTGERSSRPATRTESRTGGSLPRR